MSAKDATLSKAATVFVRVHLKNNRGARANLKRCSELRAIYLIEQAHVFVESCKLANQADWPAAYWLAALLAHLPEDAASTQSFGKILNESKFSKLRFQRLLEAEDLSSRFQQFRRGLAQISYRVSPSELAKVFVGWQRPEVFRQVAYDYFAPVAEYADTEIDPDKAN